jgi:pimeloyl-ACP methyl ester carboxylesterase
MAPFRHIAGHPTYEFGAGETPLVIIPGLSDAFQPPRDSTFARLILEKYYYRPYLDEYTLYVMSRSRHLPSGTTTREMAADYAAAIDQLGGPVHIKGLSMGGLIGLYLAADYPDLVGRFVCAVSGVRCSAQGRDIVTHWRDMAETGDILGIYLDSIPVTYGEGLRSSLYEFVLSVLGPYLLPEPANPRDVVVQAQACLDHDAAGVLADIEAPTLVVGGDSDPIFPPAILEETAAGIDDARLEILANSAHGAFEQRKNTFDSLVTAFLDPETDATL